MPSKSLYTLLAFAGALPFVGCALLPVIGIKSLPFIGSLNAVAASYGLAIASFMAGAHWGLYLRSAQSSPVNLFVTSNAIVLAVWFAYLSAHVSIALATEILAFAALLAIDYRLKSANMIDAAYLKVRAGVTAVVVIGLAITLVLGA